jgi:hypothetical protein
MAVPSFLATTHRYLQTAAVVDVNTIISNLQSELVTNGTWTLLGAGNFKSPVDSSGRFWSILATRIDATTLQVVTYDQNGTTVATRRIKLDVAGNTVRYFTGEMHCHVVSVRAVTPEHLGSFMVDPTPDSKSASFVYIFCRGYYDGAGANAETTSLEMWVAIIAGTPASAERCLSVCPGSTLSSLKSISGTFIFAPFGVYVTLTSLVFISGFIPQVMAADTTLAFGSTYTVPIDIATTAIFMVISSVSSNSHRRFAIRAD